MFRILMLFCTLAIGATQGALPAMAQEFPKKQPIKVVVATNAGGTTDVLARITAEFLQRRLGQAVIVENRPGAAGTIGADYVAKSPADGYTLFLAGVEFGAVPAVRDNLPYKFDEFTYLIRPFVTAPLLVTSPKLPVSSAEDLIAHMKANPGKVRYGSTGVGAIVHLGVAMFESATGVKGVHVPYTGIAPVYTDLVAGTIDFTSGALPPFPDALKVLAAIGTKRNPAHPDVPTLTESGIKNAGWDGWFGFLAPRNLPTPVADRLVAELGEVYKDPEAIEKFNRVKIAPEANPLTRDEFKKQAAEENKNWKAVVEREKIVVQQ